MSASWKEELAIALAAEDHAVLIAAAGDKAHRVLRFLNGRLYDGDEAKWRAVRALGAVLRAPQVVDRERAVDLLRRLAWALNDESGGVPFGAPEAMGEILAARPELQLEFLPILCSLVTEEAMSQTGVIERGALWALGRVGPPVAAHSPAVVVALRRAASSHPETETRETARRALRAIGTYDSP